jgi:hypothetical protein
MDIPSLFMIPSAVSSGKVHSVFPNSTDADFDFNRDSDATRVNSEGLIERVGYYGNDFVVNGGFDTNSNWGLPTGWSIENGKLNAVNVSAVSATQNTSLSFVNKSYKVIYTISDYESGDLRIFVGGTQPTPNRNANGTYTEYVEIESANSIIYIQGINNFTGSIDNISIQEITGDRARLNYEIEGGLVNTKPSLLLEPQSTNIVTYSEDFSQSYWTKSNTTINVNQSTSPDGTLNADSIVSSTTNSVHFLRHTFVAVSANTPHTYSFFIKANGYTKFGVRDNAQTGAYLTYDLETESIINSASMTVVVNKLKDDWFKCSFTSTIGSNGVAGYAFYLLDDSYTTGYLNTYSYTGDGVSGFYIYGFQLEQQSYATSYIPTNGSVQSRASETCNGAGTSSILPSEEGILYADMSALADDNTSRYLSISDGSFSNRVSIFFSDTSNIIGSRIVVGGSSIFLNASSQTQNNNNKIALKWKLNDYKLYINGVQVAANVSAGTFSASTLSEISFNDGGSGVAYMYGKIRDIRVYNTKEMTDSEVDILLTKITS